ncbi:histidine kinase [Secundilactobacillus collinoides]|uniref:histidine kinase n=3 Tax=Secundilactobacillus collinoides TaxID=33960 RepID=A0A0R2BEK5_SECCO|nr:histidine protein kinase [Secundilactobacillus collinoides DSM 20515 = JCM 1123]KZL43115.1 histidine kinase [Secundilactobacillus collinoides]
MTDLMTTYFENAPVAIMLFQDDDLILSNRQAQCLHDHLHFDPRYLIQMAQAAAKDRNASRIGCSDCAVCQVLNEFSMPVLCGDEQESGYYMVYKLLDDEQALSSLTLKNQAAIDHVRTLADHERNKQTAMHASELERKRISADLHDNIAQGVYSAIMGVKHLSSCPLSEPELKTRTLAIADELKNTLVEVKDMALDVRPSVLDQFGLFAALKTLAKRLQTNSGVAISVLGNAHPEELPRPVQSALYRVAQEAMNNTLKHANATEIDVLLIEHDHFITLQVIDDGDGFNVSEHQAFNGHSLGLHDMNDRIKSLNGIFDLQSDPQVGTTITVKFPVQTNKGSFQHV